MLLLLLRYFFALVNAWKIFGEKDSATLHLCVYVQQQQQQQKRQQQQQQQQLLQQQQQQWTPSTASLLIFSPPAEHVSAPSSATGTLLKTSAQLVWTSLSWLHSSCTTSAVPRALSSPPPPPPVTRHLQVKRFGAKHRDTVNIAAASLLSLGTTEACRTS